MVQRRLLLGFLRGQSQFTPAANVSSVMLNNTEYRSGKHY